MKKFNKLITKFTRYLQMLLVIAMGLLGILMILLLFREFVPLVQEFMTHSISHSNSAILDEIIVFFLFFEFASMIVAALRHNGHTSLNFLMSLGVTALVRGLITTHGNPEKTLIDAIAILILIIAIVVFNKNMKDKLM
ncbi:MULTISPECIES: phosphate-starvation-inducible protein PsiE [Lactobacillus]|uniref:Protein PsiE n=1 Tax=Lactobacillus xujianguonis TaxID=2495899 RepID=A0A437SVA7_9LACO|nr:MULTISPECIES: phosphate-starvation-inducible protein PsiE [Lactobacillus]RVU70812.1 phosphate-starvation-inducible protein PsiE [Lactobacillus xujianguonis]RVU76996.1 phosphate-starvation-inducible protein PsiE [Lactobacillus xujianguonis]